MNHTSNINLDQTRNEKTSSNSFTKDDYRRLYGELDEEGYDVMSRWLALDDGEDEEENYTLEEKLLVTIDDAVQEFDLDLLIVQGIKAPYLYVLELGENYFNILSPYTDDMDGISLIKQSKGLNRSDFKLTLIQDCDDCEDGEGEISKEFNF